MTEGNAPQEYNTPELRKPLSDLTELSRIAGQMLNYTISVQLRLRSVISELEALASDVPETSDDQSPHRLRLDVAPRRGELLTISEVGVEFGISRTTLYKLRKAGAFPKPIRISQRKLRFRREDIEGWLSQGGGNVS